MQFAVPAVRTAEFSIARCAVLGGSSRKRCSACWTNAEVSGRCCVKARPSSAAMRSR